MNVKKTTRLFLKIIKVLLLWLLIIVIGFVSFSIWQGNGYKYSSDVICVSESGGEKLNVKEKIFTYSTEECELFVYYCEDGYITFAALRKAEIKGETKYRLFHSVRFSNENALNDDKSDTNVWQEIGDINYLIVRNKEDINSYDTEGMELIGIELTNIHPDGTEETFWVYIVARDNGILYNPSGANVIYI